MKNFMDENFLLRQKLRRSCIMNMRLKCLLSITTAT